MLELQEKLKTLLTSTDSNGKSLTYKPEEEGKIYLDIDGSVRCLGRILLGNRNILYHKMEDERNIFRKTDAWSINAVVAKNVDTVWYETMTHDYTITKQRIEEFGQYFHFENTTELKLYVPRKYWEKRHKGLINVNPIENKRRNMLSDSWYETLKYLFDNGTIPNVGKITAARRAVTTVYPENDRVFRALKLTPLYHTKVVIIGQDPYYDGSADGLAFSYLDGSNKPHQKSLNVIWEEIERTVYGGMHLGFDYNLKHWADQGVLLLNTILTVEKGKPLSHSTIGWQKVTGEILRHLNEDLEPKVFLIWGTKAKEFVNEYIVPNQIFHEFLYAPHPASDLYKKDKLGLIQPCYPETFSGCDHFVKANQFLKSKGRKEIKW